MLLAALVLGCDGGGDAPVDAAPATADGASLIDAATLIDAAALLDADPNLACDPSRTHNWVAQRPIEPGDFCDDIQLCAASAAVAAAVIAAVPGFECVPAGGEGGCEAGQRFCRWNDPDEIDAAEWASLCEITVLDVPPMLECFVYL
jgi:hypothetical protein